MRESAIANSSINPDNIKGHSGFNGDQKKVVGARRIVLAFDLVSSEYSYDQCTSVMGGCQGAAELTPTDERSGFLGKEYPAGGLADRINESFAGPHDWFRNATGSYDANGNPYLFTGARLIQDVGMNYALAVPAAPFAVSGLLLTKNPSAFSFTANPRLRH